jgi:hypothetical protein
VYHTMARRFYSGCVFPDKCKLGILFIGEWRKTLMNVDNDSRTFVVTAPVQSVANNKPHPSPHSFLFTTLPQADLMHDDSNSLHSSPVDSRIPSSAGAKQRSYFSSAYKHCK